MDAVFELVESDGPVLALNLEDRAATDAVQPAPLVTPTRLLALLDKAKAFPLLKKQQPEAVAGAEARTFGDKPQVTDFNDYEIHIEEVFRFNPEDTRVFHVTLRNKSEREIRYLQDGSWDGRGRRTLWNEPDGQTADCADRRATDAAISPAATKNGASASVF